MRHDAYYMFRNVSERMLGQAEYSRLLATGSINITWPDFTEDITTDGGRRKSVNGTIMNLYKKNYDQYFDISDTTEKVRTFVLKNRASVCATIWGHGGVGKTAMVQNVCDQLSLSDRRQVDYIVFASAKDRAYSHQTGSIVRIDEPIDSYPNLIRCINATIGSLDPESEKEIVGYRGKLLIVIDDYETYPQDDREKIEKFVTSLDVSHHKVLIATRANVMIGERFETDEFGLGQTIKFLVRVAKSFMADFDARMEAELDDDNIQRSVLHITSGRPLFIFQFAYIWAQKGRLNDALSYNIRDREEAIGFLYGRIYDYLSTTGKELFRAVSVLVKEQVLTNVISKLRYILNLDADRSRFDRGMEELIKLRIVEVFENGLFRVYSIEILAIMRRKFDDYNKSKFERGWRGHIIQRANQVVSRSNTEEALLEYAKSAKGFLSEQEVVELHRQILNRDASPARVRSAAILSLTDYLFSQRGKKEEAIGEFARHQQAFIDDPMVVKMYATYQWSEGERREAIGVLRGLFRGDDKWKESGMEFELRGLCLMYASIDALERNDKLSVSFRLGEVGREKFRNCSREIESTLQSILRIDGLPLCSHVRELGIENLSTAAKQNVITGLYQLSSVCMRIDKHKVALDICNFAITESRSFMARSFINRKNSIEGNRTLNDGRRPQVTRLGQPKITFGEGDRYVPV